MPTTPRYKLVSFVLCPFVQRSVIVLRHKKVDFDIEYIDLKDKPQWFLDKVPTGKVPALFVGDEVLFESAIINEYLDETTPPSLLAGDPWARAQQRAWISYSDRLFLDQFAMLVADNEEDFAERKDKLLATVQPLAQQIRGPYFSGPDFSLVDAAIAPFLTRLALTPKVHADVLASLAPASPFAAWMDRLLAMESIQGSVVADFAPAFAAYFHDRGIGLSLAA